MRPPSTTPTIGEAGSYERGHGYGMVLFASILLIVIGCFNLIHGIAAIAHSHVFTATDRPPAQPHGRAGPPSFRGGRCRCRAGDCAAVPGVRRAVDA